MGKATTTRLWWVRHAPVVSDGGRIYGARDVPADCSDTATFAGLARMLPEGAVWYASHLARARQTAEAIGAAGLDVRDIAPEPALGEQDFGEWQGRDRETVYREQAEWHRLWLAPVTVRPPGGESFVDLTERVGAAVGHIAARHPDRDVCIVAHGGSIRAALGLALRLAPEAAIRLAIANCSVTRLDHIARDGAEPVWRVAFVNRLPAA